MLVFVHQKNLLLDSEEVHPNFGQMAQKPFSLEKATYSCTHRNQVKLRYSNLILNSRAIIETSSLVRFGGQFS